MNFFSSSPTKVLVTGAGGQTGAIVVRKLLEQGKDKIIPRALVRSTESETKLKESLGDLASSLEIFQGDVSKPSTLAAAFKGMDAVVICTSAMPRLNKLSLPGVILTKIFTLGYISQRPSFFFEDGGCPEMVDWLGQREQIDVAKTGGVKHIVLVSSMAGTKPEHFLNVALDNIVLWKRRAECYLIDSGIPYTIIHPGGLLPHPGPGAAVPAPGGKRQLYVSKDDALLDDERKVSTVPREDVAEVCVQCVLQPYEAKGRSFDLGSGPETEEAHPLNLRDLLTTLGGTNCAYTAQDAMFKPEPGSRDGACGLCSAK